MSFNIKHFYRLPFTNLIFIIQGFLCPFCFVPFPTGDALHSHFETSHSENLTETPGDAKRDAYICPACKVKLGSEIDLQSHYAKLHASEKNEVKTVYGKNLLYT